MNKFMEDRIKTIDDSAGFGGLEKELKREKLYVDRMGNDSTYSKDKAVQDNLENRREYILALQEKLKTYSSGF